MKTESLSIQNSVSTKLFRIVFAIYFFVAVLVTIIQMVAEYNHVGEEIQDELALLETSWEPVFSVDLWNFEIEQLQTKSEVLSKLPIIIGVKIEDEYGNILASQGKIMNQDGKPVLAQRNIVVPWSAIDPEQDGIVQEMIAHEFDILSPGIANSFLSEQIVLGKGTFYTSPSAVLDRVEYGFILILINAIIKAFALWTIVLLVAQVILVRPLKHLTDFTRQINLDSLEKFQLKLPTKTRDEFKVLEETFNTMLQTLLQSREALKRYSQELEVKNQALKQLDQLKDEFLATTSHELHTPLHGIIGVAEYLLERCHQDSIAPVFQTNLRIVLASGKRLANLVDDIMDFSRMKHHKLKLNLKAVDVSQVMEVVLHLSQHQLDDKAIQIQNYLTSPLPPVLADENRLMQIFHNLVDNAIKFTPQGQIEIQATVNQREMVLTIADTGIGISPDHMEQIFDSFEQAEHAPLTRRYEGMGLGLTITRQLVELHHGSIHVESELEKGSTFFLTLPLATDHVAETTASAENAPFLVPQVPASFAPIELQPGVMTILVVDDDVTNLQVVANYLMAQRFSVVCFQSGEEALLWVEKHGKPDLLLLDIMMPNMNGFEVCKILRQQFTLEDLPIVFLTASHRRVDLATGFEAGANDFLTKPFDHQELLARIQTHLQVLQARVHLTLLREFANRIAEFKDHEEMLYHALETVKTIQISDAALFKSGKLSQLSQPHYLFLSQCPTEACFTTNQEHEMQEVLFRNHLPYDSPILQCYNSGSLDLVGSHMAFLRPKPFREFLLVLYRNKQQAPFSELERQYFLNMLDQLEQTERNIQSMLSDKLVQVLPEIQPHLSKITHISSAGNYCNVFYENKSQPALVRVTLSSLDLYFDNRLLVKVHKSHLINPQKIVCVQKKAVNRKHTQYEVILGSPRKTYSLPIGGNFVQALYESFPQHFVEKQ